MVTRCKCKAHMLRRPSPATRKCRLALVVTLEVKPQDPTSSLLSPSRTAMVTLAIRPRRLAKPQIDQRDSKQLELDNCVNSDASLEQSRTSGALHELGDVV